MSLPQSKSVAGGISLPLKSNFQASSWLVSKSLTRVWCFFGLKPHRGRLQLWQGRIRRTNITWIMSISLMSLSIILWICVCSAISSSDEHQFGLFSTLEVSRTGRQS